jgi:uncharacterized protein YbjT (DUF2867 family)
MTDTSRRVLVAGASGLIGVRLVGLLVAAGHQVAGLTRTAAKVDALTALGAEPVVADALDGEQLSRVLRRFAPDIVLHELTDLPDDVAELAARHAGNARLLRDGTRNLIDAAPDAHVVAQSIAWRTDADTDRAYDALEAAVLGAGGGVIRYGQFYGPGTYYEAEPPEHPRIHIDAAARTAFENLDLVGMTVAVE